MALPATASSSRHTEAFLGKEEESPSQTAVKASDAALGELQSKEEQQHQKGSNRQSELNTAQKPGQGARSWTGRAEDSSVELPTWAQRTPGQVLLP